MIANLTLKIHSTFCIVLLHLNTDDNQHLPAGGLCYCKVVLHVVQWMSLIGNK